VKFNRIKIQTVGNDTQSVDQFSGICFAKMICNFMMPGKAKWRILRHRARKVRLSFSVAKNAQVRLEDLSRKWCCEIKDKIIIMRSKGVKSTLDSFCAGVKKDYVETAENAISGCLVSCNEQGRTGESVFRKKG
jgi:hypothetical protein